MCLFFEQLLMALRVDPLFMLPLMLLLYLHLALTWLKLLTVERLFSVIWY